MTNTTLLSITRPDHTAYAAALEGAAFFDESARGRILMRDRDRAALLHRLSTNHVERLRPGEGAQTVLTTPIGRIIDVLTVFALDDALLVQTSPGRGPAIVAQLKKNIFFNDKVKLEDATESLGQLALYGPRSNEALAAAGLGGADLPAFGIVAATLGDAPVYVARTEPIGGAGFTLIAARATLAELEATLRAWGAVALDEATHDVLRIEQGYAAYGRELSQDYIPLETGLWSAVSFNKGCYVGQEIIARMESRGRLAKQLRGLRFDAAPELAAEPQVPLARLAVAGKESGDLTSLAVSPRYGLIGLAYVRTAHAAAGTTVGVGGVSATVVELPFAG